MAESKATVPHFYLQMEIDMTEAVEVREQLKEIAARGPAGADLQRHGREGLRARALREFPRANGSYRDGQVELYSRVNVGIAVAAQDALVVPTIFDADRKSLGEIAAKSRELAQKVRDGTITPPELSGGTFTVSNLGMFGVDELLGRDQPAAGGAAGGRGAASRSRSSTDDRPRSSRAHMMGVTLACDHRILYGADGAQFLGRVRDLLEQPLALAL